MIELACTFLVDSSGALLLQLRDSQAPNFPDVWGLPGGHVEPGETAEACAVRELLEETGLQPEAPLQLFVRQELPAYGRAKTYFFGTTRASQSDVVLGEGAAMVFVPPAEVLARPFTPGSAEVIERFLASPEYQHCLIHSME